MKAAIVAAGMAVFVLSACSAEAQSEEVAFCLQVLEDNLRSPSTLSIVSIEEHLAPADPRIDIEFDASNGYGAIVRDTATCIFNHPLPTPPDKIAQLKAFWMSGYTMSEIDLALTNVDRVKAALAKAE